MSNLIRYNKMHDIPRIRIEIQWETFEFLLDTNAMTNSMNEKTFYSLNCNIYNNYYI